MEGRVKRTSTQVQKRHKGFQPNGGNLNAAAPDCFGAQSFVVLLCVTASLLLLPLVLPPLPPPPLMLLLVPVGLLVLLLLLGFMPSDVRNFASYL